MNIGLKIGGKLCCIITLYRTPSQSQLEFENFFEKLELSLDSLVQKNAFLILLIGDLNAKSINWYKNDKWSFEGKIIENDTTVWFTASYSGTNA